MDNLCATCLYRRVITSGTGSQFVLCTRSQEDKRFPKYPRQPLARCEGYEPAIDSRQEDQGEA